MYEFFVFLHNLLRWVALILGVLAAGAAIIGWLNRKTYAERDRKLGSFFAISMDVQILVGLILYLFFSPYGLQAFRLGMGTVMGQSEFRFFAVEHVIIMLLAVVFAHLGSILPRRAKTAANKYRQAAIWFSLAVILLLAGMPWARPLLPGL